MGKARRIGNVTAGLMVAVAALFDVAQGFLTFTVLLLPLSILVTFFSLTIFFLWFALLDVKYVGSGGGRKLLTMVAMTVTELAPVINALPATTAGVIGIIVQTRIEDARANTGGAVTPRTAMAALRLEKMRRARASREDAAREAREGAQEARHAPIAANDNQPENIDREAA